MTALSSAVVLAVSHNHVRTHCNVLSTYQFKMKLLHLPARHPLSAMDL